MLMLLFPAFYMISRLLEFNVAIAIYITSIIGILVIIHVRKDLIMSTVMGGLAYGLVYFLSLVLWFTLYPDAENWFTLENLPRIFILGVPLYEILFGFLQGAYWGNIYEFLFGYTYKKK